MDGKNIDPKLPTTTRSETEAVYAIILSLMKKTHTLTKLIKVYWIERVRGFSK